MSKRKIEMVEPKRRDNSVSDAIHPKCETMFSPPNDLEIEPGLNSHYDYYNDDLSSVLTVENYS